MVVLVVAIFGHDALGLVVLGLLHRLGVVVGLASAARGNQIVGGNTEAVRGGMRAGRFVLVLALLQHVGGVVGPRGCYSRGDAGVGQLLRQRGGSVEGYYGVEGGVDVKHSLRGIPHGAGKAEPAVDSGRRRQRRGGLLDVTAATVLPQMKL